MSSSISKHRVVIGGSGFGGLADAFVGRGRLESTIIEHQLFALTRKPLPELQGSSR